jgi:phosphoglycolate phosphatase
MKPEQKDKMHRQILILFDIDGTILKYKRALSRELFRDIIKKIFNVEIPYSSLPSFAGMTDLQILKDISSNIGIKAEDLHKEMPILWVNLFSEFKKICNTDNVELLSGAKELINLLANDENLQLGLLTGNFKENAYLKLNIFDLGKYFPFGAFGNDHENRNELPPIAIKRANEFANYNKYLKDNTVIVGDSPRDIECARVNSIPVLAVSTGGFTAEELKKYKPDFIFDNLTDYKFVFDTLLSLK